MEKTLVLCKDGKLVIPKSLQHRAVSWHHHYLQHPGHTHIEETLKPAMYGMGMRTTTWAYVKYCRSCQANKGQKCKYGKLPAKLSITTPWEALGINIICPYTIKGKGGTIIDFMCLTMIDPVSSWFEIAVELPVELFTTITSEENHLVTKVHKMT